MRPTGWPQLRPCPPQLLLKPQLETKENRIFTQINAIAFLLLNECYIRNEEFLK